MLVPGQGKNKTFSLGDDTFDTELFGVANFMCDMTMWNSSLT